jgi:hypothetical protein
MPWPRGVPRAGRVAGLTPEEEELIEDVYHQQGIHEGVRALHYRLVGLHGANAPSRKDVADWLRREPSAQTAKMPRKHKSIAPVLPAPTPLSVVFMDSFYLPRTAHNTPGVGYKVYRVVTLYICALTKFVHLSGQFQLVQGRPMAAQVRDGAIEFIRRARAAARDPNLHPRRFQADKGPEHSGAFEAWRAQEAVTNPGFYQISKTPGNRSSFVSIGERSIQSIKRLLWGQYKSWKRDLDERGVPQQQRPIFDWMDGPLKDVENIWNTGLRQTIKTTPMRAIDPQQAPDYQEVLRRITAVARKRYGNRIDGEMQPGYSGPGFLSVGDLVRRKLFHSSGVEDLKWSNSKMKTHANNFTMEIYRVRSVNRGQGLSLTRYEIEQLDGDDVNGMYSRQELLFVPPETLQLVESDDDDDDDDEPDEQDDEPPQRPVTAPDTPRYQVGDYLVFAANWFRAGDFQGLFVGRLDRDRRGRIRAVGVRNGVQAYQIDMSGRRAGNIPWFAIDEVDTDDDVTFAGV